MFGFGTGEILLFGVIAVILFGGRLPPSIRAIRNTITYFAEGVRSRQNPKRQPPLIGFIELVTKQRESTMTERFKKFLWSPAFWALLGILGCTTGLYFQRVAANGSGLWCLGLIFLGAAYLENQE